METIDFIQEKNKFGLHVRKLREKIKSAEYPEKCISLQEITDKTSHITKKTLGNIERGQTNPKFETLLVLAQILNVSLLELIDY